MTTENKILPELGYANADQTPCSYVSIGRMTKAAGNASSVSIKGLTDRRNITLTFVVTLQENSYPCKSYTKGKQQPANQEVLKRNSNWHQLQKALLIWDVFRGQKPQRC